MIVSCSLLHFTLGFCSSHGCSKQLQKVPDKITIPSRRIPRRVRAIPSRDHQFRCHCLANPDPALFYDSLKNATSTLARSLSCLPTSPLIIRFASGISLVIFGIWVLVPLVQQSRNIFLRKSDRTWKKSSTYYVTTSYVQPLLLWAGAIFLCRSLETVILPAEASQIVKQRVLYFVRSLATVLAFAHCLSRVTQQAQKVFMETNDPNDPKNMGFQFASRAIYTAVWVASISLFMELLGFSTQRWLTAGGLGTVLLSLAGREILTNFLSSLIIHATRPFVLSEWIQTKIQGYEVSGTVERVGWWSPTIIRGDDREAIYIPNHKFTVNIVRNLSQKTHWRVKTHLAISHLDVGKINNIVADMRKVLSKNPQVEQQKLHRRVFLDNVDPENQALRILISCFVKTSRFEEYLCVKEGILLDLLRVISHHRARLATPIRTVQKVYIDAVDMDDIEFPDSIFTRGAASRRTLLLTEPSYKINGDDKMKKQPQSANVNEDEDSIRPTKPTADGKTDTKDETVSSSDAKTSILKQSQQDSRPLATATPSLEENILLGVALDGSKRTLPIEEETVPPLDPEDTKKFAATSRSSSTPAVAADKEKGEAKWPPIGSSPGDQKGQPD